MIKKVNPNEEMAKMVKNAAQRMDLQNGILDVLLKPEREHMVNLQIRMDDGTIRMFPGFRVQHNNALGPYKGGTRYWPTVNLDEI